METRAVANDAAKYEGELTLADHDKIVIVFTETVRPYQRIHLQQLLFRHRVFVRQRRSAWRHLYAGELPISAELPKYALSFELYNRDGKFNVDADVPVVQFLKGDQQAHLSIGYDLDGRGKIEWIDLCRLWLDTWTADGIKAKFNCSDVFKRLNDANYEESEYGLQTVKSRVDTLMAWAGYADEAQGALVESIQTANPFRQTCGTVYATGREHLHGDAGG